MEPVVIIQHGARLDEPVLRWAAAYAQNRHVTVLISSGPGDRRVLRTTRRRFR